MKTFLQLVAQDLYCKIGNDLSRTAIIFLTNVPVCSLMNIWQISPINLFGHRHI